MEHLVDGRAALQRLASGPPVDLMLLDLMLPYATGKEILTAARADQAWHKVPVVMLTAKSRESDIVERPGRRCERLHRQAVPARGAEGAHPPPGAGAVKRLALAAASFAAAVAAAQPMGMELRPFVSRENLDNGYQDWSEAGAELAWRNASAHLFAFRARETQRYGLHDIEAAALVSLPVAAHWNLSLEATGASGAQVLPEWSAVATLARALAGGWVVSGSWKETQYTTAQVSMATAGLERYVASYRFAYTVYLSRPHGESWSPTHRLTASWYGEGLTRLEAGAARGRESENTPAGLVTSDVRTVNLSAASGITPSLGLTVDLERQRQGDLYTRKAIRLGARVFF